MSLFIAPDAAQIRASRALEVDQIELNTGEYCNAAGAAQEREFDRLQAAASLAAKSWDLRASGWIHAVTPL